MGHFNNIATVSSFFILGDNKVVLYTVAHKVVYKVVTRLLQGCYKVVTVSIAYL